MNGIRFLHESYFYSQHSNIFFYKQLKTMEKLMSYREKKWVWSGEIWDLSLILNNSPKNDFSLAVIMSWTSQANLHAGASILVLAS